MNNAFGLAIAVLCIVGGSTFCAFPQSVACFQEDEETTPAQAIRQLRVGGLALSLFGLALLYAIAGKN
jgi:hypothetical protein